MAFMKSARVTLASLAVLCLGTIAAPAANAYSPDIDGDGIPNTWEMKGYDADGDGKIDANDVTTLQMYIAKYADVTVNEAVADVDGNGKINVLDVTAIQKYVAGGFDGTGNAGKVLENIA